MSDVISLQSRALALSEIGKEVAGLTVDYLSLARQTIHELEGSRWNELTGEQKIENLEDLSKALLFQRLLETGRFDMFHVLVACAEAIGAGEKSPKEDGSYEFFGIFDIDGYIDYIAELPRRPNDIGPASSVGLTIQKTESGQSES